MILIGIGALLFVMAVLLIIGSTLNNEANAGLVFASILSMGSGASLLVIGLLHLHGIGLPCL